jgi:hypothetical protein
MKRRNEDDVGPVENWIAAFFPKVTPKHADCGEPVDKSAAGKPKDIKSIFFKLIYDCNRSDYPQELATCLRGGRVCPKPRDKVVHSGISVPVRTGRGAETPTFRMFARDCGNDP